MWRWREAPKGTPEAARTPYPIAQGTHMLPPSSPCSSSKIFHQTQSCCTAQGFQYFRRVALEGRPSAFQGPVEPEGQWRPRTGEQKPCIQRDSAPSKRETILMRN